ncbi:septum formation initiator family protein [Actinomadura sp. BRA 177]|uniref:FtsB family cell division protein n=1 Tax=Actinomadura sp. BRA 177 TaxID=2745202 RepID=UPI0015956240|nr:septum formation initiator family protein [Actinomadura sp. BRA 177]NVI86172.1 septum formation initiator family protein [Actinomadura sp. BRA 177]
MAQDDDRTADESDDDEPGAGGRRGNPALTSRAAILAVVVCAIALSLAYPVREYIAQRKEIADLRHKEALARRQVEELVQRKQQLGDKSYIEREATRRLHYCRPDVKCYVVLDGSGGEGREAQRGGPPSRPPWYETLWRSVEAADRPR